MAECPNCGRQNLADSRFCSGCGTELAAPAAEQLRKTVTVVFCDLVGSTALGERLDPESVRRIVNRYFDQARTAIERHGGTVEKFIGDAVMSVFGIPQLHEDDAMRALRAAADLRSAVKALGQEVEHELGINIEARIGVATGEVIAGDHRLAQGFVTGDVVNVAARLEQAAGAGEVLLADRTRELAGDGVRVEPAGPLSLKGKSEPVAAWRLVDLDRASVPARPRSDSGFVGRERELSLLSRALERVVEQGACEICTVVGPPGIGKSRIAEEFTAAAAAGGNRVVVGRCLPYGDGITYWPLREIVHQAAGSNRIEDLLDGVEDATVVAERIAGALGSADPTTGAPEETFWAFRKLFHSLARERPLIVVVDEIQWAEPTLLDLLEYLVAFGSGAPMLVLCLTRPELLDQRSSWTIARPAFTVVTLEPLAEDQSSALVHGIAAARGLSEADFERIVVAAEGNPLFLEQLIAYSAGPPGAERDIPPSIQTLLATRIDRLSSEQRAVILRASVEGKTFHSNALAELLPERARSGLDAHLRALERQEFIRPDASLFADDKAFRFGHSLIREAAYRAAPKELRAEAHERYADWLEQRAGENLMQYEEIVGYHLEQAHRFQSELGRPDEAIADRAANRLGRAGARATTRGDIPAAVNLLERSIGLASPSLPMAAETLYWLGIARKEGGELEGADEAFSNAVERAERAGDARLVANLRLDRLALDLLTGRATNAEIRAETERLIQALEQVRDNAGLAKAWLLLAETRESLAQGEQEAERAFEYARLAGLAREEADALFTRLTYALYGEKRPVAEVIEQCERLAKDLRGPMSEAGLLEIHGALRLRNGEVDAGRALYAEADRLYRELGMKLREAINWQCRGTSEFAIGDFASSEAAYRNSAERLERIGERQTLAGVLGRLAYLRCDQGRADEAVQLMERSEQFGRAMLGPAVRARLVAARGDPDAAIEAARGAVAAIAELDWPELRAQTLVSLAEVLHHANRPSEEAEALHEALSLYERKGILPAAERVRARLVDLQDIPAA